MSRNNGPTEYRFEVLRYDAAENATPRLDCFAVTAAGRMSVLECLLKIQDEQDPSLAFRYSCRGAVCGSCAMSINGRPQLACRVLLKNLSGRRVVLEPLPSFEIIRDLVVDMDSFWRKYEQVRPWLHAATEAEKETRMSERERAKIDQYVNCILCGLCYGACPVLKSNPDFIGPAALAKLQRFLADSREDRDSESLEAQDSQRGMWGCHTITRCIDACPKNVRPTDGITGVRRRLLVHKLKKVLGRA